MNNPRGMPRVYHPYVMRRGGPGGVTMLSNLCYKQVILNSKSEFSHGRNMLCEIFFGPATGHRCSGHGPTPRQLRQSPGCPVDGKSRTHHKPPVTEYPIGWENCER